MKQPSVLVIGNDSGVQNLFFGRGYKVVFDTTESRKTPCKADLVCFTGGEDISPSLYDEKPLFRTRTNPKRDADEVLLYEMYSDRPKVGICRGGQFLNVMSGGKLWQHVTNHSHGPHTMIDLFTKTPITVTSVHHQMMDPGAGGYLIGIAENVAGEFWSADETKPEPKYDTEVVWYPKTKSLCYQPHPEYHLPPTEKAIHQDYFFKLIDWAFN